MIQVFIPQDEATVLFGREEAGEIALNTAWMMYFTGFEITNFLIVNTNSLLYLNSAGLELLKNFAKLLALGKCAYFQFWNMSWKWMEI